MRIVLFCHSLVSDWNHGNAHFLRGVTRELLARGHDVRVYEPLDGWSRAHLVAEQGRVAVDAVLDHFPELRSTSYEPRDADLAAMTEGADAVIVHEWNDPELVRRLGALRVAGGYRLLFHDTHHRAVTRPEEMARYDLRDYDGVLAFGGVVRDLYIARGWTERAWTWHEAADIRTFHPLSGVPRQGDLVWVGNWGDGERGEELRDLLVCPVSRLHLRATVHGVRYPDSARATLAAAGIRYAGWIANHEVPRAFAAHAVTVHVPRRPYVEALPGIPTIRPFEAMACGIPLVSAWWDDCEHLFEPGQDYLVARDGHEMETHLRAVLHDEALAASLREHGLRAIRERHTCAHRVDELLSILGELGVVVEDPVRG